MEQTLESSNTEESRCCSSDDSLFFSPKPSISFGTVVAVIVEVIVLLTATKNMSIRDATIVGLIVFFGTIVVVSCCTYSIIFVLNAVGCCDDMPALQDAESMEMCLHAKLVQVSCSNQTKIESRINTPGALYCSDLRVL